MKTVHKTREGFQMLIADMTDEHLNNTIKGLAAHIKSLRLQLDSGVQEMTPSQMIMYKRVVQSPEKLATALEGSIDTIAAYVLEASLRGLSIADYLRDGFGRAAKLSPIDSFIAIGTDFQLP